MDTAEQLAGLIMDNDLPKRQAAEIKRLREAAATVVHEYLRPGSIGSRVEYYIYRLRDELERATAE